MEGGGLPHCPSLQHSSPVASNPPASAERYGEQCTLRSGLHSHESSDGPVDEATEYCPEDIHLRRLRASANTRTPLRPSKAKAEMAVEAELAFPGQAFNTRGMLPAHRRRRRVKGNSLWGHEHRINFPQFRVKEVGQTGTIARHNAQNGQTPHSKVQFTKGTIPPVP